MMKSYLSGDISSKSVWGVVNGLVIGQAISRYMLEQLFGSKTRVKLISLFLRHSDEPLFVRELTRRIQTQINAVRRELANLVRFGLLIEEAHTDPDQDVHKKGKPLGIGVKKKFYRLNPDFPLLADIRALFVKAQILVERRMDQELLALGDVRYLAFLGMFIGRPSTTVDVFLVGHIPIEALRTYMANIEQELGTEIKFSQMTFEEFMYRKDMTDKFLYAILEAPKHVVVDRLNERSL